MYLIAVLSCTAFGCVYSTLLCPKLNNPVYWILASDCCGGGWLGTAAGWPTGEAAVAAAAAAYGRPAAAAAASC